MLFWHLPNNLIFLVDRKRDGLMPLFLSGMARKIAVILLALFSPVYIFQTARSLGASLALAVISVLFYELLFFIVKFISLSFSENLSQKTGFKWVIWASAIPFILFIPAIIFASTYPVLFLVSAFLFGIHSGLFWWGYHGYFIKTGDKRHFGHSVGEARFLETATVVVTPFLGAVITSYLGFSALFIFSGLFMLFALLMLGRDHDKKQKRDVRLKDVLSLLWSHKSISLAYIGSSAEVYLQIIAWPVFLFLFFGRVISLGIVVSVASFLAAIFALVIGGWVDRQGEKRIVTLGVPLSFASWLIRIVQKSMFGFILAESIWNFGQRMVALPLNVLTYKKAFEAESAKAILFRETALILGGVSSMIILSLLVYLSGTITVMFPLAALFSLLPLIAVVKRRITDASQERRQK